MPTLLDAADAFSQLGKKSVRIQEAACVRVRHRQASCHACLQVCAHEAIRIENNVLSVEQDLCTGCGACACVCPTEALCLIDEPDDLLRALIDNAHEGDTVVIACEYLRGQPGADEALAFAASQDATHTQAAFIACLATIDETLLVHAACAGVALHYCSADCTRCPNAKRTLIGDVIEQAAGLWEGCADGDAPSHAIRPRWDMHDELAPEQRPDTSPEMSRRGMFDHLVARTTDSVAEAAVGTFYVSRSSREEKPTLAQSLMEDRTGLKRITVSRNARVLNDLYDFDPALVQDDARDDEDATIRASEKADQEASIPTRLFGEMTLDATRCDLCGICMTFCPTGALSGVPNPPTNPFVAATRAVEEHGELMFRANDCVACHLCVDVCPRDALQLHRGIARADLFALEPRTLLSK